ncbi:MAG: ClpP family protease [Desulfuromonadales bacterium]|nr:ClpP family protease [Desulfuromonadales bacterium]
MKESKDAEKKGLDEHGIIFLSGPVDGGSAETLCKEIIQYNLEGKVERIQLIVNSPGGSCADGFAVIDLMEWSKIPVYTIGVGMVASMGLLILMAGQKGRRVVTPNTSLLSHRFSGFSFGNHSQLLASRKIEDQLHERIITHYLSHSRVRDRETLEKTLLGDVDYWMSPQEALDFGLIDIVEPLQKQAA